MILSVRELKFGYPGWQVFQNIDFSVEKGDCLAILGTNGAGKSTLLKCLNRILRPQGGVVHIQQDDISRLSPDKLAQKIGYVAQRHESARLTVFDAVLLGRKPYIKWDEAKRDIDITMRVLKLLNLTEYSLRYIDELSGGELQKVVIARALAQEPEMLLLDEPTSNLDLKNQVEVVKIIKQVVKGQQIAAIVTMHDINLAIRFADKFIFLKDKTVFAAGGIETITPEVIESVYSVPVSIERFKGVPVVLPV